MKKIIPLVVCLGITALLVAGTRNNRLANKALWFTNAEAQAQLDPLEPSSSMTPEQLETVLKDIASNLRSEQGQLLFDYEGRSMAVLTSAQHNRMRILAPITNTTDLSPEDLQKMLVANFHSALDARYAISNGVVYAAFLHPLSSLGEDDFRSALRQVAQTAKTFGTTYSSGGLGFGAPAEQDPSERLPAI